MSFSGGYWVTRPGKQQGIAECRHRVRTSWLSPSSEHRAGEQRASCQAEAVERGLVENWAEALAEHASLREIDDSEGVEATVAGFDGVRAQGADARAA